MNGLENLLDKYCQGWSATSEQERERLLRESLAEEAIYSDPRVNRIQIPDLLSHISQFHASMPGAKIRRTSNVDFHHGFARFNWLIELPDGSVPSEGSDTIELSRDGTQISRIIVFFGQLQALNSDA